MRNLLFLLFVLPGVHACSQHTKSTSAYRDTSLLIEYESFENHVFFVDGKTIEQRTLTNYPDAELHNIYPGRIRLKGHEYAGAVYFYTAGSTAPPIPYADDPAWFINGVQVSPFDIRSSRPELYTKIEKSTRDTVINGKRYKGAICVDTEEDFFAQRIALPEVLDKYPDLPAEHILVHWHSISSIASREPDISMVILDHFPIYHLRPKDSLTVKVYRLSFAEDEQYIIHVTDDRYRRADFSSKWMPSRKARAMFENPLAVDTSCPCYLADLDTSGRVFLQSTELKPEPFQGEEMYLKKLSETIGLPAKQSNVPLTPDSITVQFLLTKKGMLAEVESLDTKKSEHDYILQAIKRHSCLWSMGINSGNPLPTMRKMTIFYSKDQSGKMVSLDDLAYRYDK